MTRARATAFATLLCGALVFACGGGHHGAADASADGGDSGSGGKHGRDSGEDSRRRDASTKGDGGSADSGVVPSTPGQCPGTGTPVPGYACRSDADCDASNPRCLFNAIPAGCGACFPNAPHLCDKDGDCGAGMLCVAIIETNLCPCSSSAAPGTRCEPKCTSSSCNRGERCEADGRCAIRPCDDGYACEQDLECDPKNASADAHGCVPKSCASDGYTCPKDFVCVESKTADAHGCSERSCADGFMCAANFVCDPKSSGSHHCEKRACKADSECDCGFCIQQHCEPRLFVCTGAQAP